MAQWAYDNNRRDRKPFPVFFVAALHRRHQDQVDWWHRGDLGVALIAAAYLLVLIVAIRLVPGLRQRCTRCVECTIPFVTAVTNQGRQDLRCPMGCRERHRRKHSSVRGTAYYQTPQGKIKKKQQNDSRLRANEPDAAIKQSSATAAPSHPAVGPSREIELLSYLQMLVGAIERRRVEPGEIQALWEWIKRGLRQHPFENPAAMMKTVLSDG